MAPGDDNKDGPNDPPKNPWGRKSPDERPPSPWGSNGGGRNTPPDLGDMLKKAQDNFRRTLFKSGPGPGFGGLGEARILLVLLAVIAGLWLLSGFYLVSPGENAVVTRFGKWTKTQELPGLGYRLPWPIDSAEVLNVSVDRRIQIGFAEGGTPSNGRNAGGKRDIPEESLMLTADANIVDLDLVVLWNIDNARDYKFNVRDQEQTIKKVAQSALREVVGQTDLQPIITGNRNQVAVQAQKIMQDTLNAYKAGISIKQVVIQEATVHPDVIEAFEDVVAATQDAERFQNEANIYRNDIVPRARGEAINITQQAEAYKESVVAKAQGDAARFNAMVTAVGSDAEVTKERLYIETMEEVMGKAQKIIVDKSASGGVVPYLPLNEMKPAAGNPAPVADNDAMRPPQAQAPLNPRNAGFGAK